MTIWRRLGEFAASSPADLRALAASLHEQIAETHAQSWTAQTRAWTEELVILEGACAELTQRGLENALLVFEYDIPRRLKRPDLLVITDRALVVVEFKVGAETYDAAARWQATEYALDLRDFHSGSHKLGLAAVVVATLAPPPRRASSEEMGIPVIQTDAAGLADAITAALRTAAASEVSPLSAPNLDWLDGKYRPTPTIIEAAEMLYKGHGIAEINHSYAQNITETTQALVDCISNASRAGERVICFVTGVPGAGKTLTGLDAVHDPRLRAQDRPAGVFLSGNGPLVRVIQEALASCGKHPSKKEAKRTITTFVQNVHRFVQEYEKDPESSPPEHVIVVDEAQRAWSREKMAKKRRGEFSEAEQLLEIMERVPDWAVVVALVGGGQEIHDGEAGLGAWGDALNRIERKPWKIFASPESLSGGAAVSGHKVFREPAAALHTVLRDSRLHLNVSVRSPRAQFLSEWVDATLAGNSSRAAKLCSSITEFPLVATRDLDVAKAWLRAKSTIGMRTGLVASAGAKRLRAYGIQLSTQSGQNSDIEQWFLAPPDDVRSSSFLEVAATEFECQGLELDYVGLCWGDDLSPAVGRGWAYRKFRGSRWGNIQGAQEREYLLNKYRVLLTRARKGMIIWIPRGSADDQTRDPIPLDRAWDYLISCGVTPVVATGFDEGRSNQGASAPAT